MKLKQVYTRFYEVLDEARRGVDKRCTITTALKDPDALDGQDAAVGAALVMFVGIAITLLGQLGQRADDAAMRDGLPLATDDLGGDLAPTCSDPEPVEAAELTSDERLDAFVATFGLTERERDILEVLVVSDQSVQDIATTLFLSRSTLYRHISSINKKAGTASRVALINFFWSWTPKD